MSKHTPTPGPWSYIPSTEHHGPYVTSYFGSTICDCYAMSQPSRLSTASGGPSKPVPFLAEMADPNARLIAAAPDLLEALKVLVADIREYERINNLAPNPGKQDCWQSVTRADAAIAKAEGSAP